MMDFDRSTVEWRTSPGLTDYPLAVSAMEKRAAEIRQSRASEIVWLLEHPPLYTAGTSARSVDLKDPGRLPVFTTGRGGQYTYHGPGQRIAYVMLDVQERFGTDVRAFVATLERWIIDSLSLLGIAGEVREGRVGVWVTTNSHAGSDRPPTERKIAAIGIRVSRGVSYHGISLNVSPELTHYDGIVPCGIADHGVTSLRELGRPTSMKDVDMSLRQSFERHFGPTTESAAPIADMQSRP